ncbi:hypothetical protein V8E36_000043 [Tilletia maclaganii]
MPVSNNLIVDLSPWWPFSSPPASPQVQDDLAAELFPSSPATDPDWPSSQAVQDDGPPENDDDDEASDVQGDDVGSEPRSVDSQASQADSLVDPTYGSGSPTPSSSPEEAEAVFTQSWDVVAHGNASEELKAAFENPDGDYIPSSQAAASVDEPANIASYADDDAGHDTIVEVIPSQDHARAIDEDGFAVISSKRVFPEDLEDAADDAKKARLEPALPRWTHSDTSALATTGVGRYRVRRVYTNLGAEPRFQVQMTLGVWQWSDKVMLTQELNPPDCPGCRHEPVKAKAWYAASVPVTVDVIVLCQWIHDDRTRR